RAADAVRDQGFRDRKLSRVISLIHPENIPSRRVAEKNGMKVEKDIMFRGFPTLLYAITRQEWLAKPDASWTRAPVSDTPPREVRSKRIPESISQSSAPRSTERSAGSQFHKRVHQNACARRQLPVG